MSAHRPPVMFGAALSHVDGRGVWSGRFGEVEEQRERDPRLKQAGGATYE